MCYKSPEREVLEFNGNRMLISLSRSFLQNTYISLDKEGAREVHEYDRIRAHAGICKWIHKLFDLAERHRNVLAYPRGLVRESMF